MLLILITLAWLAVVTLVIAACRSASRADAQPVRVIDGSSGPLRPGLVVWDELAAPSRVWRPLRRSLDHGGRAQDGTRVRSRRLAGHGIR